MPLIKIAPYVGLLLIGQTALDAAPLAVAAQEGGMGPGSALIVGYVLQVGGLAIGAAAAAHLVDRGSSPTALVAGSVLLLGGLVAVLTAPMGALGWVLAGLGVAGCGYGLLLTTAFSAAADVSPRHRPFAIMLLLLAALAARIATGVVVPAAPLALIVAGAIVVAISVLLARSPGVAATRASEPPPATGQDGHPLSARGALLGGVLVAAGAMSTLVGADSSRVSAFAFTATLGLGGLDVLDRVRVAMVLVGPALFVGGAVVLLRRLRPDRARIWAVPALGLAAVAAAGIGTGLSLAITLGGASSGPQAAAAVGLAGVGGGTLGLLLGGWWLSRGLASRLLAIAGSLVLAGISGLGLVVSSATVSFPSDVFVPALVLALSGFGGALVAVGLRLALAESETHQRGLAAGAGVVAAAFGSALGSLLGTAEATRWFTGETHTIPVGLVVLATAGIAALGAALLMPSPQPVGT